MTPHTPRLGHNQGPPLQPVTSYHLHGWRKAHRKAWKSPPIEIVRRRVRRAGELGLDYRRYTSILLDRGCTPEALTFESAGALMATANGAVSLDRTGLILPHAGVVEKLSTLERCRVFVVGRESGAAAAVEQLNALCGNVITAFRQCLDAERAETILELLRGHRIAPSACVLIGAGAAARMWKPTATLGAFVPATRYFAIPYNGSAVL